MVTALCAHSTALFSPEASPVPIIARPILLIIVLTSAKSKFIKPGTTIKSVILLTPAWRTSSAIEKASANVVFSSATLNKFWFGITIVVSTRCSNSLRPCSAILILPAPSNWKGLVTTATVRIPSSLATRAITGAAPVPVPPPIPAVIKSMLVPSNRSIISCLVSSADDLPISGWDPAPSPLVTWTPSCIFASLNDFDKACASVLAATNSTPDKPACIMLLIALPPAPPTPKTVILGFSSFSSGTLKFKTMNLSSYIQSYSFLQDSFVKLSCASLEVLALYDW